MLRLVVFGTIAAIKWICTSGTVGILTLTETSISVKTAKVG